MLRMMEYRTEKITEPEFINVVSDVCKKLRMSGSLTSRLTSLLWMIQHHTYKDRLKLIKSSSEEKYLGELIDDFSSSVFKIMTRAQKEFNKDHPNLFHFREDVTKQTKLLDTIIDDISCMYPNDSEKSDEDPVYTMISELMELKLIFRYKYYRQIIRHTMSYISSMDKKEEG